MHALFAEVALHVASASADGLLADLGVSSMQLENAARGFSFQAEWPVGHADGSAFRLAANKW